MAIVLVRSASSVNSSYVTLVTPAAGNLLVCAVMADIQGVYGYSTYINGYNGNASRTVSVWMGYRVAVGNEATEYFDNPYGGNVAMWVGEFSGCTASPVDKSSSGTDTSVSTHTAGPTATTVQADELVVAAFAGSDNGSPFTCSGYTVSLNSQPGSSMCAGVAYKTVSSTGAQSAVGSFGATMTWTAGAIATFKASVAGPLPKQQVRPPISVQRASLR